MLFGDDGGGDTGAPMTLPETSTGPATPRGTVQIHPPAPVFHPLAYRGVVAEWNLDWRERWGWRANALEDQGLSWRDAEAQAFIEVWNEIRGHQIGEPSPLPFQPAPLDPKSV